MKQQLTPRLNRLEPNLIIDGGMEIWPEGTSRSVPNNTGLYGSVLFKLNNFTSNITLTNSQQSSVPAGTNLNFSNQISKTAAGTLAAGTAINQDYFVEGYDLSKIMSQEFSVIFWVKSSVTSLRSVALRNDPATHCFVRQYAINAADTWELKCLRFPAMNTCPGTLLKTNGIGLRITFPVISGTTFQTATLNSWIAGNVVSGVGEDTTWLTGTTHDFSIAGVMVLPGDWSSLTPAGYTFLRAGRNFQEELAMSQRYFEKSYPASLTSASIPGAGSEVNTFRGYNGASTATRGFHLFKVNKRAGPTLTVFSGTSATPGFIDLNGGAVAANATAANEVGCWVENSANPVTGAYTFGFHFYADSRF